MRLALFFALAALAAVVAGARVEPAGPSLSGTAGRLAAGYNFKADVHVQLYVGWTEFSGSEAVPCSTWRRTSGTSDVNLRGTISGHVDLSPAGASLAREWAHFVAVGKPDPDPSFSRRYLIEVGGDTACGATDSPAKSWTPPANDCDALGKKREFRGQLTLRAARRGSLSTLAEIMQSQSGGGFRVIVADGIPLQGWYKNCRVSRHAPDIPANIAVFVDDQDLSKLRTLKAGKTFRFGDVDRDVGCVRPTEISADETCVGDVLLTVSLRRIKKGERFP
jgi:hypothetical protein